jgi:hypothetical protein
VLEVVGPSDPLELVEAVPVRSYDLLPESLNLELIAFTH